MNQNLREDEENQKDNLLILSDVQDYLDVACQAKRKKVTRKTQKTALIHPIYGNQSGFSYVI